MTKGHAGIRMGFAAAAWLLLPLPVGGVEASDRPADDATSVEQAHAECRRLAGEGADKVLACIQEEMPGVAELPLHVREAMVRPRDPEVEAAADAWWSEAQAAVNAHATALAATGAARDLLAATILWSPKMVADGDGGATMEPRVAGWIDEALAARPSDPLLDWLEAGGCGGFGVACDPGAARARLLRRDPDNMAVHLLELEARYLVDDLAGARAALGDAAAAAGFRTHLPAFTRLALDAHASVAWPAVPDGLQAAFAEHMGWGASFDGADAGLVSAIGQVAALALPGRRGLLGVCPPDGVDADVRAHCVAVLERLADTPETVLDQAVALPRLAAFAAGTPDEAAWRERLRDFHWLQESAGRVMAANSAIRVDLAAYGAVFAESGELAALRMLLEHHGVPLEAPEGWLPSGRKEREQVTGDAGT